MNKLEEIKNQLANRLEKQAKKSVVEKAKEAKLAENVEIKSQQIETKTIAMKSNNLSNQPGALKLSVSLYDFDISCLDKIKDFMREQGIRKLSDSEALRIACRAVETSNNFLGIYESMQMEDRRRKRV
jgi:hypothetical protein